jgi:hypothetical protein
MTVVEALHDALRIPNPHASQDRVHEIVARRLDELTPESRVRTTGYFNHSWAPDMIVTSGDEPERPVFLRFDVRDLSFADDLEHLSAAEPLFVDLSAANPDAVPPQVDPDEPGFDLVEALARVGEHSVLVTDVPAIDTFDYQTQRDRDVLIATQQIVVGGQGLVDRPVAEQIANSWTTATAAASSADTGTLRTALDRVEVYLSRIAALDLETALRGRWIASGQPAETFPGREDWTLADRSPAEIARLVLSLVDRPDGVDFEQWRQIASAVSASQLGHELYRIGEYRDGGAVNELVAAGLGLWTAQYAYVPPLESDSMERFDWSFGDYSLALNLISRRAYFTDIGAKWSRVPRANVLPDAKQRLPTLQTSDVRGAGLVTTEENITQTLRPSSKMSLAQRLEQLLEAETDYAFRAARLELLEVRVPGTDATATVDFRRSVVRASVPVPLRTFALLCGRFVAGLHEDELAELEKRLASLGA